uniref:Docking protein 2 n=1 Tax=Nothobranchius furzeri TaxID=105023 RepID=A0A8C6PKH8_NOTFU
MSCTAGRRCNSGEGSFEFDTKQGNVLFQTVETAINLQKISLPHRQVSGGVPPEVTQNHLAPGHSRIPNPSQTYSHIGMSGEAGADPLYDSIDEMKIRNIFKSPADSNSKVDHIYDEPEGCAIPSEEQKATPPPSVYDNPEEMRGGAWRCMGTTSDPTGHEYPYNPCVDDYAVPKRAQRAFISIGPSEHLSMRTSVLLSIRTSVHENICPPVHENICPPVHLSFCPPVHLSFCPSEHLSFCPWEHLSICP